MQNLKFYPILKISRLIIFFFLSPVLLADNMISAIFLLFSEYQNSFSQIIENIISSGLLCSIVLRFILSFKIWYICLSLINDEEYPIDKLQKLLIFYFSWIFITGILGSIFPLGKTMKEIWHSFFTFLEFSLGGFLLILYSLQFKKTTSYYPAFIINICVLTGLIFWLYQFYIFVNF